MACVGRGAGTKDLRPVTHCKRQRHRLLYGREFLGESSPRGIREADHRTAIRVKRVLEPSRFAILVAATRMNRKVLDQMAAEDWAKLMNSPFRLEIGGRPITLRLAQVQKGGVGGNQADDRTDNFSLIFVGPGEQALPQKMYRFEHEQLVNFDMFIVPVGKRPAGFEYEAVFNRLMSTPAPGHASGSVT